MLFECSSIKIELDDVIYFAICSCHLVSFLAGAARRDVNVQNTRNKHRVGSSSQLVSLPFEISLTICRERSQTNKKAERAALEVYAKEHPNGLAMAEV